MNWNSISKCKTYVRISLQEYIDELASVTHQLPSEIAENLQKHSSQMNFARAALVLQNSSSIYSRKVEYLHSLVYEALNSLMDNANEKNPARQRGRGHNDPDIDAFLAFDIDLEFLPLGEDVLPIDFTGEQINLDDDDCQGHSSDPHRLERGLFDMNTTAMTSENGQKATTSIMNLSAGVGMSITRYDQSIQHMTIDKESVNSHAANALLRNLLDGNASVAGSDPSQATLRLMNGACDISDSGALHMPGTGINFDVDTVEEDHQHDGHYVTGEKLNTAEPMEGIQFDNYHDDGVDDDHDGPGFDLNDSISSHDRSHKVVTFNHETNAPKVSKTTNVDPWALLDPHDVGETKHKPLHVGNSLRLPHECEDLPSDSVTGARTKKIPRAKPIEKKEVDYLLKHSTYTTECYEATVVAAREVAQRRRSIKNDDNTEENIEKSWEMPTKLLTFGEEFQYILKAEKKRKNAEKRKLRRLEIEKSGLSSAAIASSQRFHDMYNDDDDDDNDGPGFDLGGDDDHSFDHGFINTLTSNNENRLQDFGVIFGVGSNDEYDERQTFEALCRAHLKEFAKGAEKYAMESQLSKRVDDWQNKVSIVLREEEERPEFNIQSYTNQILSIAQMNIQGKSKFLNSDSEEMDHQIPFVSVTRDLEPYDVSRIFLASLMLCNTENIKFSGINVGKVTTPEQLCVEVLKPNIESHVDDYFESMIDSETPVVPKNDHKRKLNTAR